MGRKLDALLGRKFKKSKFKATVSLAISRLSVLKNQHQARLAVARSDVTQLLDLNHHEHALLRVDQVIKEQNVLDVFVMIDGYCHLLLQRINLIEQEKDCPDELKEAASSLLYAAPRCGEFPVLQEIRAILTSRFGKEFAYGAIELRNNCGVNLKMIQKLSPRLSSLESRTKILREIASENGIVLQLEDASPVIEEGELVGKQKQNQQEPEAEVEDLSTSTKLEIDLSFSESMKGRKKFRDVEHAAQAAFESAAYAAAAARAAVELSRSGSFGSDNPDSPNSRPRKVLDSKPLKSKLHMGYEKNHESEDSDEYEPLEQKLVFDESDNEIENVHTGFSSSNLKGYGLSEGTNVQAYDKQFPFSSKEAEFGPGNTESLFGEGSKMHKGVEQLDLNKRPISVRTKRVYGP